MALSNEEQNILQAMADQFHKEESDTFTSKTRNKVSHRSLVLGILLTLAGFAILITGANFSLPIIGILGFCVMFSGVLLATKESSETQSLSNINSNTARPLKTVSKTSKKETFSEKMERRWEDRWNNEQ